MGGVYTFKGDYSDPYSIFNSDVKRDGLPKLEQNQRVEFDMYNNTLPANVKTK